MDMLTKLPEMSDDALANLRSNAKRLQQSGTPPRRTNAAALLPAVEAEIGARRLAKIKVAKRRRGTSAARNRRAPTRGHATEPTVAAKTEAGSADGGQSMRQPRY